MHTHAVVPPPALAAVPLPPVQAVAPGTYRTDDDSVMLAQKHAKWAMSALNFEDVNTAVKELRLALQTLGAL
jgi:vacuolar protein sorting-associated protein VTA1